MYHCTFIYFISVFHLYGIRTGSASSKLIAVTLETGEASQGEGVTYTDTKRSETVYIFIRAISTLIIVCMCARMCEGEWKLQWNYVRFFEWHNC